MIKSWTVSQYGETEVYLASEGWKGWKLGNAPSGNRDQLHLECRLPGGRYANGETYPERLIGAVTYTGSFRVLMQNDVDE